MGLSLAVGQPLLIIVVAFAFLALTTSGARIGAFLLGAAAFVIAFAGDPTAELWYLERGWAILAGGWFAGLSLAWPERPFAIRGLAAVAGSGFWAAVVLASAGGWGVAEEMVRQRIRTSADAALELMAGSGDGTGLSEAITRTVEFQSLLFPSLLGLSTFACLGVAWWLHVRVLDGSDRGLGRWRDFRFPDPLIWVFISGLILVLLMGWDGEWGRLGVNVMVFMGALYAFRGAGVLLFLSGGLSLLSGLLVAVGLVLAGPILILGAMIVGLGDSWLDLRSRAGMDGVTGEG